MTKTRILNTILALPEADRVAVVQEVLRSLQPGVDELTDKAWEKELDRRAAELRTDPSAGVPWTKIKKMR